MSVVVPLFPALHARFHPPTPSVAWLGVAPSEPIPSPRPLPATTTLSLIRVPRAWSCILPAPSPPRLQPPPTLNPQRRLRPPLTPHPTLPTPLSPPSLAPAPQSLHHHLRLSPLAPRRLPPRPLLCIVPLLAHGTRREADTVFDHACWVLSLTAMPSWLHQISSDLCS